MISQLRYSTWSDWFAALVDALLRGEDVTAAIIGGINAGGNYYYHFVNGWDYYINWLQSQYRLYKEDRASDAWIAGHNAELWGRRRESHRIPGTSWYLDPDDIVEPVLEVLGPVIQYGPTCYEGGKIGAQAGASLGYLSGPYGAALGTPIGAIGGCTFAVGIQIIVEAA